MDRGWQRDGGCWRTFHFYRFGRGRLFRAVLSCEGSDNVRLGNDAAQRSGTSSAGRARLVTTTNPKVGRAVLCPRRICPELPNFRGPGSSCGGQRTARPTPLLMVVPALRHAPRDGVKTKFVCAEFPRSWIFARRAEDCPPYPFAGGCARAASRPSRWR